jgi:hypothetical protein
VNHTNEKMSNELAKNLEETYIKSLKLPFDQSKTMFKSVEETFLEKTDNNFLVIETKRRTAEWILYSATSKKMPCNLCRQLFDELKNLGYTNLEKKSNIIINYSKYCIEEGNQGEALKLLKELEDDLIQENKKTNSPVYRSLSKTVKDFIRKL